MTEKKQAIIATMHDKYDAAMMAKTHVGTIYDASLYDTYGEFGTRAAESIGDPISMTMPVWKKIIGGDGVGYAKFDAFKGTPEEFKQDAINFVDYLVEIMKSGETNHEDDHEDFLHSAFEQLAQFCYYGETIEPLCTLRFLLLSGELHIYYHNSDDTFEDAVLATILDYLIDDITAILLTT